jgi:hypothetical protein
LFANARTAASVQAPMLVAGATSAPVVSTLPVVPPPPSLQAKSSTTAAPTPVGRAKAKAARRPASADPFDDGGPERNATAKRAGASDARGERQAGLPRRERHIFEEL